MQFSQIISLDNESPFGVVETAIKANPNPVSDVLNIEIGSDTEGSIFIVNSLGQIVFQQKIENTNRINVAVNAWANGVYCIKSGKEIVKFIKN